MEEKNVLSRTDRLELIYKEQITQVFSAESVIPDTMPDAAAILFADARIYLRSGTTTDGALALEGTLEGSAVYLPEGEGAPEMLSVSIPVTMTARGEQFDENCRILYNAAVIGAEARMVNSRKISFRAEAAADVSVCRNGSIDLTADIETVDKPEILPGEVDIGYIQDIGEKTFTVADDVDLPTSIEKILWYQTNLFVENAKKVGERTILQGGVELQLMYLPPESDTPCFGVFHIPFSQLAEASGEDTAIAAVDFRTESCFVEILPGLNSSDTVSLEMQLTAQLIYVGEKKLTWISDAYSLHCPLIVRRETLKTTGPYISSAKKTTVKEFIKLPEQAKEILAVQTRMTPCVRSDTGIKTAACICILFRAENALRTVTKKLPVEIREESAGECLYCKAVCSEPYKSLQGDGLQLQFDVDLMTVCANAQSIEYISRMEEDAAADAACRVYPSITAVKAGERSLWELAKTYHSTVALIEAVNDAECDPNGLLLIPRGR